MVELTAGWHDGYTFLPVHNKLLLLAFSAFQVHTHHRSCYLRNLLKAYPHCPVAKLNIHSAGTWTLEVFNLIAKVSPKGQMEKQLSIEYTPFFFNFPP